HTGASAVLVASILHDGYTTVADLKAALADAGIEVRP
ncbi:MAG: imidazole glycerol phosphate synthase subunit HisF, partial [Acidimicrobiia bacterium]